jgi:hypothetical protein
MPVIQPITSSSGTFPYVPNTRTLSINGITYDLSADRSWTISTSGTGTVTSVALSATMPTGLVASISGSPITSNGTLGLTVTMQSGYAIPTTAKQTQWDSAYSFTSTFPSGTAQQLLRVNTLGTALEFFTPSFLVAGDIIATTPLVWNSGTKTMSIPVATSSVNGYLSSTDWLTFSSKQPAITLTTTGNNGSATLVGATLNIPTYTLVGLGGMTNPFSAAIGQIIYSNSAGAPLSLAGNTTTTKKFLSQTGDGTNSAAPFWSTIAISDVSGAIGLTALSATSPLLYNNSTGVFSIQQASNSQNGFLSSANWTTFNSKQTQITLTTTGSSGASTFNFSTGALNIPQYTLAGLGGLSNPMTSLGDMIYGNGSGAPQRLAPNTTTTRKYLSMLGDGTNGAIPTWETITGIAGSGTTNYVAKFTSSSAVGNSSIFDNGTNVGVGTATGLGGKLHVLAATAGTSLYLTDSVNSTLFITHPSTGRVSFYNGSATRWLTEAGGNVALEGNVVVGGTTSNAKFQVNNGGLATGGTGFMVSAGLTNGRLETYDAGSVQCIHTYFDAHSYEISAGSTTGFVSGIVITGRGATLNPDRVALYTRDTMRLQVNGLGQLNLQNYTSNSSFTGTPVGYLAFDSSGNILTSNPTSAGRNTRVTFSASIPNTWLAMPSALSFFDSSTAYVTQADLSAYNQVRLIVNKQGTAGAGSSKIILRYQATSGAPFTASSYSDIGTSEVSVNVNVTNDILIDGWVDMVSGAKDDVWLAILGVDGDDTTSPVFGNIYAEFRFV